MNDSTVSELWSWFRQAIHEDYVMFVLYMVALLSAVFLLVSIMVKLAEAL